MKIGILSFAHTHATGYARHLQARPDVEILTSDPGIHPTGERRGRALADDLQVPYADTFADVFSWGPDAVIVTNENAHHRELVEVAASRGIHVLCEKPLATSWDDAIAMRAAARKAGTILMLAHPVRFADAFVQLRATYASGELGEIVAIRGANNGQLPTERAWFADPELSGGGALIDHVVHIADLLDSLLGQRAIRVTAVANTVLHRDRAHSETAGLVSVSYSDGVTATIDCSWSRADSDPSWGGVTLDVLGTRGTVRVDFFDQAVRGLDAITGTPVELRYGQDLDAALLDSFVASVSSGQQPQPDADSALRSLQVVLAAQESNITGRTVTIEPWHPE